MNIAQAANYLYGKGIEIGEMRVRKLCMAGDIKATKDADNRWTVEASDLDDYIGRRANRTPAAQVRKPRTVETPYEVATYHNTPRPSAPDDEYVPQGKPYVIYIPPMLLREANEFLNSRGILTQSAYHFSKRRAWAWQQAHAASAAEGKEFDPRAFFARTAGTTPEQWFSVQNPDRPLPPEPDAADEIEAALESETNATTSD
jgi:hypothetical protein